MLLSQSSTFANITEHQTLDGASLWKIDENKSGIRRRNIHTPTHKFDEIFRRHTMRLTSSESEYYFEKNNINDNGRSLVKAHLEERINI